MKIRADRKRLAEAVQWVAQAIPKNPNVPALGGIRLIAADDHLTLSAFDYDVSHEARVPVEVGDPGECLVSGAFLRTIVAALPGKSLDLELDGAALVIGAGRSTYRTQTLDLDNYPALPPTPDAMGTIDAALFAGAVTDCIGSVDDEHATEGLRGLRIEAADDLELVGVDGKLLIHRVLDWDGAEFAATVPSRALTAAVGGLVGAVTIGSSEATLSLSDAERTVIIRTMSGQFAQWRRVPRPASEDRFAAIVDRDELGEAVKRAALLTKSAREGAAVCLTIEHDHIEITSTDDGANGSEVIDAASEGREVIMFSPMLLGRALSAMDAGEVRLGVGARRSADMGAFLTARPAQSAAGDDREAVVAARKGGEAR